jgi:hypothetical protein
MQLPVPPLQLHRDGVSLVQSGTDDGVAPALSNSTPSNQHHRFTPFTPIMPIAPPVSPAPSSQPYAPPSSLVSSASAPSAAGGPRPQSCLQTPHGPSRTRSSCSTLCLNVCPSSIPFCPPTLLPCHRHLFHIALLQACRHFSTHASIGACYRLIPSLREPFCRPTPYSTSLFSPDRPLP